MKINGSSEIFLSEFSFSVITRDWEFFGTGTDLADQSQSRLPRTDPGVWHQLYWRDEVEELVVAPVQWHLEVERYWTQKNGLFLREK